MAPTIIIHMSTWLLNIEQQQNKKGGPKILPHFSKLIYHATKKLELRLSDVRLSWFLNTANAYIFYSQEEKSWLFPKITE